MIEFTKFKFAIFKSLFSKGEEDFESYLPNNETASFALTIDNIEVGILKCHSGEWSFKYSPSFKDKISEYRKIIGFPDLEKVYQSNSLWPFFRTRIPGLKQPAIKEIIERENINKENELELLKRFGKKTITNPYILNIQET
ncbi:MAG: hypothetical protein GY795_03290 [Desulfobacterales bacterium]|nr:hypothetical protein [Desulfobacterales bacterium]